MKKTNILRQAFNDGANGEPKPKDFSRTQRTAHRLGRMLFSPKALEEQDRQMHEAYANAFEDAKQKAVGANKQAMAIIEAASSIPNTSNTESLWGTDWSQPDGSVQRKWLVSLSSGKDQDPTRPHKTPVTTALGSILLENKDGSRRSVPVDNVVINCSAPIGAEGMMGPTTTNVAINTRPYEPGRALTKFEKNHRGEPNNQMQFTLAAGGDISEIAVGSIGYDGCFPVSRGQLNLGVDTFLSSVLAAVDQTASEYKDLGQFLKPPI